MLRSKLGLKVLGLCAVVLGTMAFASVAQAEPNAFWLVNGANKFTTLKPLVEATTDVEGALLTTLGGKDIVIRCKTILLAGHLSEPLGQVLGSITFDGCKFFERLLPSNTEHPLSACTPIGETVKTNAITGLIKLHTYEVLKNGEGKVIAEHKRAQVEATPTEAGKPFATILLGEECSFGEKITIGGKFWLSDSASETSLVTHLVSELASLTALTVNGGATPATIDGSANAFLGGAHKGMTFSARPG